MAYDNRRKFWFGTEERAGWFVTPNRGADSSPTGWSVDGTLLNGGGWALNSWGTHKRYTYEWPSWSSREVAQLMKSYRDGTYGRGLLYFIEPTIYTTNVLPAHWADPSMSVDNEAPSLIYGLEPSAVQTSGGVQNGLPVYSAYYALTSDPQTDPVPESSVYIPIPENHTLFLGAFYSATGTGGVFASPVNSNGTFGAAVRLTEQGTGDAQVVTDTFSGVRGIRLWVGRTTGADSTVTIAGMIGRILRTSEIPTRQALIEQGPWVGGQGHSGCRFLGTPSYETNGPIGGGQIGFAASFIEVGSWALG